MGGQVQYSLAGVAGESSSTRPSPDTRTVSVSSTPPADDTTPLPAPSTRTDG